MEDQDAFHQKGRDTILGWNPVKTSTYVRYAKNTRRTSPTPFYWTGQSYDVIDNFFLERNQNHLFVLDIVMFCALQLCAHRENADVVNKNIIKEILQKS